MNSKPIEFHDTPTVVRLFPLPETVLFPQTLLPLHIFEPRYRQMTADALASDRKIGIILPNALQKTIGTDGYLSNQSQLHKYGCIGSILNEQALPDGRYIFVLRGETRFEILEELDVCTPYRQARVCFQYDALTSRLKARRQVQRAEILSLMRSILPADNEFVDQFIQYLTCRHLLIWNLVRN